jgi:GNAT superfamily N-acetyltransferase
MKPVANAAEILDAEVRPGLLAYRAAPSDADGLSRLMLDTARWLHSTGSTQWAKLLVGEDDHRTPEAIARGDVFGFREPDREEWAGMAILQWNPSDWDRRLWGNADGRIEQGVYLHRLMVNRGYAGTGLGAAILRWSETKVRYPGKDWLRLDCIADNAALSRLYPSCGFRFCRESAGFHLYEKPLPA